MDSIQRFYLFKKPSCNHQIRSRLRWFGNVDRKDCDELASACRRFEVNGVRDSGRGGKPWDELGGGVTYAETVKPEQA